MTSALMQYQSPTTSLRDTEQRSWSSEDLGPCRFTGFFLFTTPSLLISTFATESRIMKVRLEVAAYWLRCGKVASRSLCQVQLRNPG
jgi:hypothetical protein